MGEVPESLPVTEETRERLRAQANQVGEPTVVRLPTAAVAVDDMRQAATRAAARARAREGDAPGLDLARES